MIRSKVIDILKTLSKEEIKEFDSFLETRRINRKAATVNLYNQYQKYYPQFDAKGFTKENIYRKIFPGKKYSDEIFRNLNSALLQSLEEYLSYLNYSADAHSVKVHLLRELLRRNMYSTFDKNFSESTGMLESHKARDQDYFGKESELYLLRDLCNSFRNKFQKQDIQCAERSLIISFVLKILEIQNYILYECRLLGLERDLYLPEEFVESVMKCLPENIRDMPQVQMHYNAFMLEKTGEEKYFSKLKSLVSEFGSLLEEEKRYNKYIDMIEYLKRSRTLSDETTLKEVFELRREIIEKGLHTENYMNNMFYLNMTKSGLRLGQFEWVEKFIEEFRHMISDDYRDSTFKLAKALICFEKMQFRESLSELMLVKYEDSYYNLQVRNLTSRIYYELNETDLLNDYLNSYRIYISKNRTINKKEADGHVVFIRILGKLLRIRESGKMYKLDELMPETEKLSLINKPWLIEKMHELES